MTGLQPLKNRTQNCLSQSGFWQQLNRQDLNFVYWRLLWILTPLRGPGIHVQEVLFLGHVQQQLLSCPLNIRKHVLWKNISGWWHTLCELFLYYEFLDMESVGFYIHVYKSSKIIDFIFNVLHCSIKFIIIRQLESWKIYTLISTKLCLINRQHITVHVTSAKKDVEYLRQ